MRNHSKWCRHTQLGIVDPGLDPILAVSRRNILPLALYYFVQILVLSTMFSTRISVRTGMIIGPLLHLSKFNTIHIYELGLLPQIWTQRVNTGAKFCNKIVKMSNVAPLSWLISVYRRFLLPQNPGTALCSFHPLHILFDAVSIERSCCINTLPGTTVHAHHFKLCWGTWLYLFNAIICFIMSESGFNSQHASVLHSEISSEHMHTSGDISKPMINEAV